jgi:hypothetical protein
MPRPGSFPIASTAPRSPLPSTQPQRPERYPCRREREIPPRLPRCLSHPCPEPHERAQPLQFEAFKARNAGNNAITGMSTAAFNPTGGVAQPAPFPIAKSVVPKPIADPGPATASRTRLGNALGTELPPQLSGSGNHPRSSKENHPGTSPDRLTASPPTHLLALCFTAVSAGRGRGLRRRTSCKVCRTQDRSPRHPRLARASNLPSPEPLS